MIANQENYLFLKQCLVAIRVQRAGGEITIANTLVDPESICNRALNTITEIRNEFSNPTFMETVSETTINFNDLFASIDVLASDPAQHTNVGDLIKQIGMPLEKAVMDYPVLNPMLIIHRENLANNIRFPFDQGTLERGELTVRSALDAVKYWIESPYSEAEVMQMVLLLNVLQLTDELIEFCNDRFIEVVRNG